MTHPSIYARTQPDKIAYQMAGTGKAITYREPTSCRTRARSCFVRSDWEKATTSRS